MNTHKSSIGVAAFDLLVLFALPCLLMGLGGSVGVVIGMLEVDSKKDVISPYEKALATPWKELEGQYAFVEIIDADPEQVLARTKDDSLYYWEFTCDPNKDGCGQWSEIQTVSENFSYTYPMKKGKTCPQFEPEFIQPPSSTVECALGYQNPEIFIGTYYALLTDGSIWFWEHPLPKDYPHSSSGILMFNYMIHGLGAGLLLGLLIDLFIVAK